MQNQGALRRHPTEASSPFVRGDVSIGKASEGDDAVAADAAQKHGAMYEAGQLSHDPATAYNNSFDALNIHALSQTFKYKLW